MSTIIFNRMVNRRETLDVDDEEEVEEEISIGSAQCNIDSNGYLPNLYRNMKTNSFLLSNLITTEKLDYMIISIDKSDEKFSVAIKKFDQDVTHECEAIRANPKAILDYIDNEELPPVLMAYIEFYHEETRNIYYSGCILAEVRDYRQAAEGSTFCNSHLILLKPTSLSLYFDMKNIIFLSKFKFPLYWSEGFRARLEAKLIYLTSPKLCLDPRPSIGILSKRLSRKKLIFCNRHFLRLPRRKLKRRLSSKELPKGQEHRLARFLKNRKTLTAPMAKFIRPMKSEGGINSRLGTNFIVKDVKELATLVPPLKRPNSKSGDSLALVKIEEYRLETIDVNTALNNVSFTKLAVYWRPFDDIYLGNLYNNRCSDPDRILIFELGTEQDKRKYIEQFIEIFTENGVKPIKIITEREGETEPKVQYTYGADIYMRRHSIKREPSTPVRPRKEMTKISMETALTTPNNNVKIEVVKPTLATVTAGPTQSNVVRIPNILSLVPNAQTGGPLTLRLVPSTSASSLETSSSTTTSTIASTEVKVESKVESTNDENNGNNNVTLINLPSNFLISGQTLFTVGQPVAVVQQQQQSQPPPPVDGLFYLS